MLRVAYRRNTAHATVAAPDHRRLRIPDPFPINTMDVATRAGPSSDKIPTNCALPLPFRSPKPRTHAEMKTSNKTKPPIVHSDARPGDACASSAGNGAHAAGTTHITSLRERSVAVIATGASPMMTRARKTRRGHTLNYRATASSTLISTASAGRRIRTVCTGCTAGS